MTTPTMTAAPTGLRAARAEQAAARRAAKAPAKKAPAKDAREEGCGEGRWHGQAEVDDPQGVRHTGWQGSERGIRWR
jgi:hypothetical protein